MINTIIQESLENYIKEMKEIFGGEKIVGLEELDRKLYSLMGGFLCPIVAAYLEEIDEEIVSDKVERMAEGVVVERRNDKRTIMMRIGEMSYRRTYFRIKQSGEYEYLVDRAVGIVFSV